MAETRAPSSDLPRVLFVCVENSCRSQMAEAFARLHGGGIAAAHSAGSRPSGAVNPRAIAAMVERGYDLTAHRSKSLAEIPPGEYAWAITMGCGDACPDVRAARREDWDLPDPKHMDSEGFARVRDEIERRVLDLCQRLRDPDRPPRMTQRASPRDRMKKSPEKLHVKVADLMQPRVMTTTPSQTVGRVRKVMTEQKVSCMPVVDPEDKPLGIVTSTDLLESGSDARPVSQVMTRKVHSVPLHAEISLAAQTMRKHHVHHVVVLEEKKLVGILSSFDVLRIVEDRAFAPKRPPTRPKHKRLSGGRRETEIHGHTD